jgi:hypothetical protein
MTTITTGVGVSRRLQALAAMGHPDEDVAQWLRVDAPSVRRLQTQGSTDPAQAAAVADVFDREGTRPGRCGHTRQRAQHAGWRTALAWDENTIDLPGAVPAAAFNTGADAAEAAADAMIRDLAGQGWSDVQIGRLLRVNRNAVLQRRTELGITAGVIQRQATA